MCICCLQNKLSVDLIKMGQASSPVVASSNGCQTRNAFYEKFIYEILSKERRNLKQYRSNSVMGNVLKHNISHGASILRLTTSLFDLSDWEDVNKAISRKAELMLCSSMWQWKANWEMACLASWCAWKKMKKIIKSSQYSHPSLKTITMENESKRIFTSTQCLTNMWVQWTIL